MLANFSHWKNANRYRLIVYEAFFFQSLASVDFDKYVIDIRKNFKVKRQDNKKSTMFNQNPFERDKNLANENLMLKFFKNKLEKYKFGDSELFN
ncbi:hypothetical protein BpHYR1_024444 [Brachionus plicatilis]|uniref:Uncharacterized protein n=1 Tax=Brachionus plicatilis TaxID=10195 RepID=A0A3M7SB73_BRAPC|nr:hypothetical protein BpHYR1_024444 [Brachionus plicatilis]